MASPKLPTRPLRAVLLVALTALLAGCGKPADYGITGPGLPAVAAQPTNDPEALNPLNLPTGAGFSSGQQGFAGSPTSPGPARATIPGGTSGAP